MGRDDRHRSGRDRSPERRRRSRSRSRDRRNRNDSPMKREVKEEVFSDDERPRKRRDDRDRDNGRDRDRHQDRDRRRSRSRENTRRRSRSQERRRDDGKKYGLEKKLTSDDKNWGKPPVQQEEPKLPVEEKQKVDLGISGKLTEDTNTFRGVVIKYNEPPEAKKPNARWRLYPFKGDDQLQVLYIHRQSAYLIGRDHKIADIPVDHPSCSKQHAVLQYRSMPFARDDGTKARRIVPYIIDLGSGNGTFLNEEKIEPQRYFELKEKDCLKFGFSTREYIVMKEKEMVSDDEKETKTAGRGDIKEESDSD